MTTQTTRDILDQARYFHHQLQAFYEALKGKIEQPKLHLILDYLAQHEERMEEALDHYEEGVAAKVADTWFKFNAGVSMTEAIQAIEIKPEPTLDDLMVIAIQLENHFVALYQNAVDQAVSPEVKEVFEQLLNETMRERMKLSRDLVDMHDLM
jgi:rubrerythrin